MFIQGCHTIDQLDELDHGPLRVWLEALSLSQAPRQNALENVLHTLTNYIFVLTLYDNDLYNTEYIVLTYCMFWFTD